MSYIQKGTPLFRKTSMAFFAAGFNTFAILYCVQPLMPEFSKEFSISPTTASLSLSVTTIVLAISMLIFGSLSEVWGRKPIMVISMLAASVFCILTAFSPNFHFLLILRTLEGISLAGLPSIAMAYLGEEIEPKSLGAAMGLYICGNSIGAVFGRVYSGLMSDFFGWHVAIAGIGIISLVATLIFWKSLPASQNFNARKLQVGKLGQSMVDHLKDPGLVCLFFMGFLLLGSNVALFNYIAYVLLGKPYSLSQTIVGWIFLIMIIGMFSSVWTGKWVDRHGRQRILFINLVLALAGVTMTLDSHLLIKIMGLGFFTYGFFGSHAIASSWVGQRATHDKAQASSLYLFLYYTGSSVGGTLAGFFWTDFGWGGVISMTAGFLVIGVMLWAAVSKIAQNGKNVRRQIRSESMQH
ncbi:MFS transporter, YNFM family, putative membrane transport protein [Fictibacillus solisalsi]|uniref:MFS transporter, YNFM family, putative membrane transport protein n=1 Tax=Fictibacillus solisalsi TaxID=459525 RepID=A0A1G9ZVN9_9BACL|nr:MFS transporter [Fictibacillus solisalsi]SDN25692.1 MFS transporter, YNFM family, putative membrane transport protein [Fictibacillus solisalsi]